ncbi:HTH-type transcriptional repressor BepR [compost metagenome]
MKKSKAETAKTRKTILRAASRAFRERGFNGVAVKELMGQAGLTHGGFYAHFPSKEALLVEACADAFSDSIERLMGVSAAAPAGEGLKAMIEAYLSPQHRDQPGLGCLIPSLGGEISRESPHVRQSFTQSVTKLLDLLKDQLDLGDPQEREAAALSLLARMVGGMLLARAVDDPELSDRILAACRESSGAEYREQSGPLQDVNVRTAPHESEV